MKMLWFFLVMFPLTGVFAQNQDKEIAPYALEGTIKDAIDKVINSLDDSIYLPLDIIPTIPINITFFALGNLSLQHVNISGYKKYELPVGSLQLIGMKLNITLDFKDVSVNLGYDADVLLAQLFPLYGTGDFKIDLKDLAIGFVAGINISLGGDILGIHDLDLKIKLKDLDVGITGLLLDEQFSQLVSTVLSALLPLVKGPILDNINKPLGEELVHDLEGFINALLHDIFATTIAPSSTSTAKPTSQSTKISAVKHEHIEK